MYQVLLSGCQHASLVCTPRRLEEPLLRLRAPLPDVLRTLDVEHVHLLAQSVPLFQVHATRGDLAGRLLRTR